MERIAAAAGLVCFLTLAYLFSVNRRAVAWRTVLWGLALQVAVALLIIKVPWGFALFSFLAKVARRFLEFSDAGSRFVFGDAFTEHFFAFKVLPTIIFVSSTMALLYYYGILQRVVEAIGWVMMRTMKTSGAESLCGAANIFVGQTEAPLFIRPYVARLTNSELHAVMVGGFATMAAGVLAVYIGFGIPAEHLLAASVMGAPAALVMSKLMFPETGEPETRGSAKTALERSWVNPVDAAAAGATDGLKLALNVAAMLIAFLALLALVNGLLGLVGRAVGLPALSLELIFSYLFAPAAWLVGIPWSECGQVGVLLGKKTVLNEFIAYLDLKTIMEQGGVGTPLSDRTVAIATYALCGFANIGSVAIQIGGIGALAPNRQQDLARLGLRALLAGTLANLANAAIAGILL
ncbi:MAG: NupC/NupG family nucleoside CNT transporter [Thermoanaerobaculum sp.]|nr:NupC/NupG family nucleoside CNT transporter [Thermoanaerobaculum sp.]MDW7967880.1 NupC/NupG family nucleoside CNT transporter [Thermoanaerobaculum sp.]